jgi:flagellar protein FlaF
MGFSVSASTALIFLALLIASGTLYTDLSNSAEIVTDARDERQERLLDRDNTEIKIVSAQYSNSTGALVVKVENTGLTTLSVTATNLLVDNSYVSIDKVTAVEGDDSTDIWAPKETLRINAGVYDSAPESVKVVTEYGVGDRNVSIAASG